VLHIYSDASFDSPILGCGYVITRTRQGTESFVETGSKVINTDAVRDEIDWCSNRGEYRALITAIRAALSYTSESVLLYSDCDAVVEVIRRNDTDSWDIEPYFPHAFYSFANRFRDWHLTNIARERNEIAHEQARIGLKLGRDIHQEVLDQ